MTRTILSARGFRVAEPPRVGRAATVHARWRALRSEPDRGQISILIISMFLMATLLVLGGVGATAVQLSRIHLMDAADAAALDAADALDEDSVYALGLGEGVPLTDRLVQDAAAAHLAGRTLPDGVSSWSLANETGTPDGRTAVVRLQGQARIPVFSSLLSAFGGGVTITVESRARSDLE